MPSPGVVNNPEGKGGFRDNPENRSDGRWSKENSFSYWMNYFKAMTVTGFKDYEKNKSEDERTVAESLAYSRVSKARKDLKEFEAVADRTEGKPKQVTELNLGGKLNVAMVEFLDGNNQDQNSDTE